MSERIGLTIPKQPRSPQRAAPLLEIHTPCLVKDALETNPNSVDDTSARMMLKTNSLAGLRWGFILLFAIVSQARPVQSNATTGTGPTIALGDGQSPGASNPLSDFMYFVPLISPAPVSISISPGSRQSARVLSVARHVNTSTFFGNLRI